MTLSSAGDFHCQRCCECVGCKHDAASFYIEHPGVIISHTFGCSNAKQGEPIDPEGDCLYCKGA